MDKTAAIFFFRIPAAAGNLNPLIDECDVRGMSKNEKSFGGFFRFSRFSPPDNYFWLKKFPIPSFFYQETLLPLVFGEKCFFRQIFDFFHFCSKLWRYEHVFESVFTLKWQRARHFYSTRKRGRSKLSLMDTIVVFPTKANSHEQWIGIQEVINNSHYRIDQ